MCDAGMPVAASAFLRASAVTAGVRPRRSQQTSAAAWPPCLRTIALAMSGSCVPVLSRSEKYPAMR
jgi:hypothetical protein